jgi:hypothetical protein
MSAPSLLVRILTATLVLLLGALSPTPAAAQSITLSAKGLTLEQIGERLARQTGYVFSVSVGKDAEKTLHDVNWKGVSLATAIAELSKIYKCEFFCIDSERFYVIPAQKQEAKELPVGPYLLRYGGPEGEEGEANALRMTLMFTAPDDDRMEAIAGLGPDLRVIDNFGRLMTQPVPGGIQSTSAIRVRLAEYWQRLQLSQKDSNAVRIRSLSGSLVLYRKVTPLRLELPIDPESLPREAEGHGLTARLEKLTLEPKTLTANLKLAWPEGARVVGRGISRTPLPFLVDDTGRVYRDAGGAQPRRESGSAGWEHRVRFEEVEGKPMKLVYDVLVKEQPDQTIPFRLAAIPLPTRGMPRFKPERRPFYTATGGKLGFSVVDKSGRSVEGEVSLGMARKTDTGWSGLRWIEMITEADGSVKLDHLEPGTYRISRSFRFDPQGKRIKVAGPPVEVVIAEGKEARIAPLRLPVAAPPEPAP